MFVRVVTVVVELEEMVATAEAAVVMTIRSVVEAAQSSSGGFSKDGILICAKKKRGNDFEKGIMSCVV